MSKTYKYTSAKGHMDTSRVQIAVRLEPDVFEAVRESAERHDVSVSEAMRRIIGQWKSQFYAGPNRSPAE